MAITQTLLDFDEYYRNSDGDKIIVNDLNYYNLNDVEFINNNLMTIYDKNTISSIPSCDCGNTQGRHKLKKICEECGTMVKEPFQKVKPLLWLKALSNDHKFMNPTFWLIFRKILHSNYDYVRWMCDPRAPAPTTLPSWTYGVLDIIGNKTYINLITNIEKIIKYLINHSAFKDYKKNDALKDLLVLYKANKKNIYSNFMPIINKKMFVMENTTMGKFTNLSVAEVIDVVTLWVKTISDGKLTDSKASAVTVNTIYKLANLYDDYYNKYLFKKPGALRKHVYGARSHFTFRSVIISIAGPHRQDDVYVPWAIGVTAFRPHLLNKLVNRRGLTYKAASKLLFRSVKSYSPLIAELLDELIADSPDGRGIPIILHRNPSLLQGSALLSYISVFKKDVSDLTLSMSGLACKPPNADFDGDELNAVILLDNNMHEEFKTLKIHHSIPDMSKPLSVSGNLTLLSPTNNILSNLLADKNEQPELDTVMHKLL